MCLRSSQLSRLSSMQCWGLCVFSLPNFSYDDCENTSVLSYYLIINSEVWPICYCLVWGHETMVCAVCLSIFYWSCPCKLQVYKETQIISSKPTVGPVEVVVSLLSYFSNMLCALQNTHSETAKFKVWGWIFSNKFISISNTNLVICLQITNKFQNMCNFNSSRPNDTCI